MKYSFPLILSGILLSQLLVANEPINNSEQNRTKSIIRKSIKYGMLSLAIANIVTAFACKTTYIHDNEMINPICETQKHAIKQVITPIGIISLILTKNILGYIPGMPQELLNAIGAYQGPLDDIL